MKTIITVTGIRPDFIRMSEIFKKLDENFNHILIHSGQHYNALLSDVFFEELEIREPNYNLGIGGPDKEHFHQTGELSTKLIELIRSENLNPDLIIFLGDSNSVVCSVALSDFLFVYHDNYKAKLQKENIIDGVHVVGNTIVEVVKKHMPTGPKRKDCIILDIHRPENFKFENRLENIIKYANEMGEIYDLPVYMLGFHRTLMMIDKFNIDLGDISVIPLQPFMSYIDAVYHSKFIISDSGTAQEEPAILGTSVIVPRDFTERPESVSSNCSFMLDVNTTTNSTWCDSQSWLLLNADKRDTSWLGNGTTAAQIIEILKRDL